MKTPQLLPVTALATILIAAVPPPAHALRVTAQATAICQGALPAFETQIRKRPLAVQNEGNAPAFVSCSFNNTGNNGGTSRISSATIYVANNNSTARTVSCTGVNAWVAATEPALYATRSVQVPARSPGVALEFTVADFPGESFALPGDTFNVSCSIGPGIGISGTSLLNNA